MFRTFAYAMRQAVRQTRRNKAMMFTSLFSITAMLLILGIFLILAVNVNLLTDSAREQFDMVEIYLDETIREEEVQLLANQLNEISYVDHVAYVSKEDAMKVMRKRWGDKAYLLDGLTDNPLPRSLQVTLKDIRDSEKLADAASKMTGVEDVKYDKTEISKILKITNAIQIGALVVILFLVIVSIVVVANTIKLTVLARGREISIMKFVGATNWFIRGPFLAEGILIGILSAVLSTAAVSALYYFAVVNFSEKALVLFSMQLVPVSYFAVNLTIIFLALGIGIGAIGSVISMRRFLDT